MKVDGNLKSSVRIRPCIILKPNLHRFLSEVFQKTNEFWSQQMFMGDRGPP